MRSILVDKHQIWLNKQSDLEFLRSFYLLDQDQNIWHFIYCSVQSLDDFGHVYLVTRKYYKFLTSHSHSFDVITVKNRRKSFTLILNSIKYILIVVLSSLLCLKQVISLYCVM